MEVVLEAVRARILDGSLPPGSQIKQSELAERLGVSQAPVREAFSQLVEEGLLERIPYRGVFVLGLTKQDVNEIYQIRQALEILAVQVALSRFPVSEILSVCHSRLDEIQKAADERNYSAVVLADLEFHRSLIEMADNTRLSKIWDSLLAQSRFILRKLYALRKGKLMKMFSANHLDIIESIQTRDVPHISQVIQNHMISARDILIEDWDKIHNVEPRS
jgi:DNA-binding GntR family transcriptional regulator